SDLPTRYPPIHRVAEDFPMVHEYLVLPDADAAADEVDAEVAATVFVDVEALLLIRPDVYAGVRRPDDGKALIRASTSGNITPLIMDVTEPDQVSAAAETVDQHVGSAGLKALVDNAGIGVVSPMELVSLDSLRWQFEVNVFGQVDVTQEFLPLLRRAKGHLVVIGSIGDRFTPPFGGPLAASKAAIASMTDAFRAGVGAMGDPGGPGRAGEHPHRRRRQAGARWHRGRKRILVRRS
ncbi:MAG: SDR family NAD(P)-dependent oxidoreductase, partial [Mycobacterium sp.]